MKLEIQEINKLNRKPYLMFSRILSLPPSYELGECFLSLINKASNFGKFAFKLSLAFDGIRSHELLGWYSCDMMLLPKMLDGWSMLAMIPHPHSYRSSFCVVNILRGRKTFSSVTCILIYPVKVSTWSVRIISYRQTFQFFCFYGKWGAGLVNFPLLGGNFCWRYLETL